MKKYSKQENKAVKIVHFGEQSFTLSTALLTIKRYIKKLPRINRGNHIQQILVAAYSAVFSSVAVASGLSVASAFFFAAPERRVFLAGAFASPLPLP